MAGDRGLRISICVFLVAIIWIVFGQTLTHDFVNFDDKTYVYGNPVVTRGLSLTGTSWAFTHTHALNWHPLTTISHMVDCQLFGLAAGGHHFTSVLLHTIATWLLFLLLADATKKVWRSAFAAALFAIHPLRVESVAWVAERKDVLSAVFFMLTLGAYVRYTRKRRIGRYLAMASLFACGLMSKPMLVTVPFVLLLLDYWPLGRLPCSHGPVARRDLNAPPGRGYSALTIRTWSHLLVEKVPLFLLSALSCVITVLAQRGSSGGMDPLPLAWRIENALLTCVVYLRQMFWPFKLAVFYPANPLLVWEVALSAVVVLGVSVMAIAMRKTRPYIFTGWFWYLGMLVPVIGIFQIGLQSHADRYTYLPEIGLFVLLIWTVGDVLKAPNTEHRTLNVKGRVGYSMFDVRRSMFGVCSALVIVVLAWRSVDQTRYWKNSETLWTHTLAVTSNNDIAHNNLGQFYVEKGRIDDAISQYEAALKIHSGAEEGRYKLSAALTFNNLGNALVRKDRLEEGINQYQKAIGLRSDYADSHFNLGMALLQTGDSTSAMTELEKTLAIHPNDTEAHTMIGDVLVRQRAIREAISHYQAVLRTDPQSVSTLNKLAWILSTSPDPSLRDSGRAVELAQQADEYAKGKNAIVKRTLAAAFAEAGRFEDATGIAEQAAGLAEITGQEGLANKLQKDADLYRERMPLRDPNLVDAKSSR